MLKDRIKSKIALAVTSLLLVASLGSYSHADVISVEGSDRVQTSIKASKYVDSSVLVISSGYSFADSLSSFNIANRYGARLVLVGKNTDLSGYLNEMKPSKAYIVGGLGSISPDIIKQVNEKVSNVEHIYGLNRYETNMKTLQISGYRTVCVADGRNFPDALSVAGLLKNKNIGLRLVNGSKPYVSDRTVEYTVGNKSSVRQDGGKRLGGANRYKTNDIVNSELGKPEVLAITSGTIFPDALSAVNIINSTDKTATVSLAGKSAKDINIEYINSAPKKYIIGNCLDKKILDMIYGKKQINIDAGMLDEKSSSGSNRSVYYQIYKIDNTKVVKYGNESHIDASETGNIEKKVPKGYKILNGKTTFEGMKSVSSGDLPYINTVFIAKDSIPFFDNQKDYNEYLKSNLKNGFRDSYVLVDGSVQTFKAADIIADGMGFELKQKKMDFSLNGTKIPLSRISIEMKIRQQYYTKEKYDPKKHAAHMKEVQKMINTSGASNAGSKKSKAYMFAKYVMAKVPYNPHFAETQIECLISISPYSVIDYNTSICEGFVYNFNQAMFLMGIPSYQVGDDTHMVARTYLDNGWKYLNVTGFENSDIKDPLRIPDSSLTNYDMKKPIEDVDQYDREMLNYYK